MDEFSQFIVQLSEDNLCAFFVLPLTGINYHTLRGNYRGSYLSPQGDKIYIHIYTTYFLKKENPHLQEHRHIIDVNGNEYLEFMIQPIWFNDVQLFIKGCYSKMSESAKEVIKKESKLKYCYHDRTRKIIFTDYRLLALDKSEELKAKWESYLFDSSEARVLDEEMELLSPPPESSFLRL